MESHQKKNILILYIYLFYNTISLVDCGHFVRQIKRENTNFFLYFTLPNKLYLHHENLPCEEMHSDYIRIVSQKSTLPKFWQSSCLPTGLNSSSPEPTARQRWCWESQHSKPLYLKTIQNNGKKHKYTICGTASVWKYWKGWDYERDFKYIWNDAKLQISFCHHQHDWGRKMMNEVNTKMRSSLLISERKYSPCTLICDMGPSPPSQRARTSMT